MRTTVLQHWGGHQKDEWARGRPKTTWRRTVEREKQGRMKELECSQGGGTEQRVLVREQVCVMRLLARTDWMMMMNL